MDAPIEHWQPSTQVQTLEQQRLPALQEPTAQQLSLLQAHWHCMQSLPQLQPPEQHVKPCLHWPRMQQSTPVH